MNQPAKWQAVLDSNTPAKDIATLAAPLTTDPFALLCIIRAVRPDAVVPDIQLFVANEYDCGTAAAAAAAAAAASSSSSSKKSARTNAPYHDLCPCSLARARKARFRPPLTPPKRTSPPPCLPPPPTPF